ncbi:MAG: Gmad2 immunoglobulin-like domain-containing protein [Candidatus Gracilibacteria bacterium]
MKRTFSWFGILAIIIIIVAFCWTQRTHAPVVDDVAPSNTLVPPSSQLSPETTETASSMIEVTAPLPNSTLTSPMTLMGRARGPWYFEASFPIELRDANNVLITTVVAQAQGEWMTEDFVPFTATLTFPAQPAGSQGMLVFKNDNPSGEPQNSMMFDVPVQF